MSDEEFKLRRNFIIMLGKTLHRLGSTAYRLENHLKKLTTSLGLSGNFLVTPTTLTFIFYLPNDQESIHVVRVAPGGLDLGDLSRVDELCEQVTIGELSVEEGNKRIEEILNAPHPTHRARFFLGYGLAGGGFALLLHTNMANVLAATLFSLLVYVLVILGEKFSRLKETVEPLSSFVVAFLSIGLCSIYPSINVSFVTLAAIILFIPGLALTMGLAELASRELMSGTARVMDAIMMFFKLYFGAYLGITLGNLCWQTSPIVVAGSSSLLLPWIAVLMLIFGLSIEFKTRSKDVIWGILAGLIAYGFSLVGAHILGAALGPFVGALAVGIFSNFYGHIQKSPPTIALIQGIIVLVPGSKFYMSLNSLVAGSNILSNQSLAQEVFLIFMSITAGLVFANVIYPPKKIL
jgi:uncharacterized membrane protein YjjP (DUF1212 family)